MSSVRRTTASCLLVAFCAVVLLTGCGGNPAASDESPHNTGSMYWDVQGVRQTPMKTGWAYSWNQSYVNEIVPCLGSVVDGKLYQGGQGLLELDVKTGKELLNVNWTKEHHIYLQGPPILWQGELYGILCEQKKTELSGVGMLYQRLVCLDATTGEVLWQSDEIGTGERPSGSPLLLNGKLYCSACFPILPSGADYGFDVHPTIGIWDVLTGKLTGRITLPSGTYPYQTNLVSDGTYLYGNAYYQVAWGHCRSMIFRYDPVTARTSWSISYPTASNDFINMSVALAVDGETLMAVFRAEVSPYMADGTSTIPAPARHVAAAFDTTDGRMLWSKTGEISSSSSSEQDPEIAMRSGTAFLTVNDGTLIAIDEHTGTQKWSLTVEEAPAPTTSMEGPPVYWYDRLIPMATRDILYVREGDRTLTAIDPETGAKLWQKTLLTREDLWEERKQLCCIVPVDIGLVVVTANSSDLCPIIELWK